MASFIWDKVKEARIEDSYDKLTVWRGAYASGLDRSLPNETLLNVLEDAGMPVLYEEYDATYTGLYCMQRIVYGQAYDQANILVRYETPSWIDQIYPTDYWSVKNSISLSSSQSRIDATGKPVMVEYDSQSVTNGITTLTTHFKLTSYPKYVPFRQLTLRAMVLGQPADAQVNSAGLVNSSTWFGLPAGYWLCAGCVTEPYDQNPTETKVEFTFISQVTSPWMELAFWEDERGQPPGDLDAAQAIIASYINSTAYTTNQITIVNGLQAVGANYFGPYPMGNFASTFASPVGVETAGTYPSGYGLFI